MQEQLTVQAKAICEELLKAPEAERASLMAQLCGGNDELRAMVDAFLGQAQDAGAATVDSSDFPGSEYETLKAAVKTAFPEGPTSRIGRYKLLQVIGEGGFGTVYVAEQEQPIRRTVALKLIKLGMDTRQVIARFEAERQALAMMDHPNIARVLDAARPRPAGPTS